MRNVKVEGDLVQKIDWKDTDGQTNGSNCITFRANAVSSSEVFILDVVLGVPSFVCCFVVFLGLTRMTMTHTECALCSAW